MAPALLARASDVRLVPGRGLDAWLNNFDASHANILQRAIFTSSMAQTLGATEKRLTYSLLLFLYRLYTLLFWESVLLSQFEFKIPSGACTTPDVPFSMYLVSAFGLSSEIESGLVHGRESNRCNFCFLSSMTKCN